MNKKIKQTDYAYIAGYIDGDGCFDIRKQFIKNRMSPRFPMAIIISSVNREILDWAKINFGGSINKKTLVPENNKPVYYFTLRKKKAIPLTQKITTYLVEKIEHAKLFLSFNDFDCIKKRNELINKMKILKDVSNLVSKYHKEEFEKFKNTVEPTKNDFAYLAGFIDAECSLNIQKYKPKDRPNYVYKILLQCNNTKAPVFKWLLQRFGGHIHFIDRRNHGKARKNQLTWRLSGKALSKILPKILPFLRHKKPVCEELMKFYKTTLTNGGARHTQKFRTHYANVIKKRERIVEKVHKLNLKGNQNT